MYRANGGLILSPSDLNHFVECSFLTRLDLRVAREELSIESTRDDTADLLSRKGDEHEQAYLDQLRADGKSIVEIEALPAESARDLNLLRERARKTEEAMRSGAEVIFQGTFFSNGWRGHSDFLERVEVPSELGGWSYEVVDTKLALRTKPYFLLQLCAYSDQLAEVQGIAPERMHVVLGAGERESFRVDEFIYYFRRLRDRYLELLESDVEEAFPYPVEHCGLCRYADHCEGQWAEQDHLSRVANIRRQQTVRFEELGIGTTTKLGEARDDQKPRGMQVHTFDRLRQQASLQKEQEADGQVRFELLPREPERGFELLPPPSDGDIYFDMEGDPFFENGLEYLFGWVSLEDGKPEFSALWGTDRGAERKAFEDFVDYVVARREKFPDMHIYHYAHYEPVTLGRLMGFHGTREGEIDDLLRNGVFVDLYRVVEQSMRISQPSYSIKKVEPLYMGPREADVKEGGDSILMFEKWLENRDHVLLDEIRDYNEEDCRSTHLLHQWLLDRRSEAEAGAGETIPWREPPEVNQPDPEAAEEILRLQAELLDGIDVEPDAERSDAHQARWLAAQILDYHRREAKPAWWAYFAREKMSLDELLEDAEALARLERAGEPVALPKPARSLVHPMSYPPQDHHIGPGQAMDPTTGAGFNVDRMNESEGTLWIKRAATKREDPLPKSLAPTGPYDTKEQRAALRRFCEEVIASGPGSDGGRYRAAKTLLAREAPNVTDRDRGADLQVDSFVLDEAKEIVSGLSSSCLFIQGPPGAGKTYNGARLILDLLDEGKRVGVTSNSHKAIHNLLHDVEKHARQAGVEFTGLQKRGSGPDTAFESRLGDDAFIESTNDNAACEDPAINLVAGTAWLFCREGMDSSVDYLFIDEAGQISLADAVALATSATNVVLLGDPLQLAQVSQGTHPPGAGASILEHLLGDDTTIPPDRGLFLDQTWRMHPDVCRFISKAIYEGRLESEPDCANQNIDREGELSGTGIRWSPVVHEGNQRSSPEEVEAVAAAVDSLAGATCTKADGFTAPLSDDQIMVVSPYNAQVRALRERLPDDIRVGTVDKFQGQEAAVVFFSMATSTGEDVPRNMEFLFSRNRLNVAISRARCLAVLVCSPALLHTECRTAGQMRLVNVLCQAADDAKEAAAA